MILKIYTKAVFAGATRDQLLSTGAPGLSGLVLLQALDGAGGAVRSVSCSGDLHTLEPCEY